MNEVTRDIFISDVDEVKVNNIPSLDINGENTLNMNALKAIEDEIMKVVSLNNWMRLLLGAADLSFATGSLDLERRMISNMGDNAV